MKYNHFYKTWYLNFYLDKREDSIVNKDKPYSIMFAPTAGYVNPPMSKEDLKGLADFIYSYLENNS